MAEIKCPVCGTFNPSELETCQVCQATLRDPVNKPEEEKAADLPDWLRSLSADQSESPASTSNEEPDQVAEWLSGLVEEPAAQGHSKSLDDSAEEHPDWLADLIKEEPIEPLPTDLPDWLIEQISNSGQTSAVEPTLEGVEETISPIEELFLPVSPAEEFEPAIPPETVIPENLREEPQSEEEAEADLPTWVTNLNEINGEVKAESVKDEEQAAPEVPEWVNQLDEQGGEPSGEKEAGEEQAISDLPAWITSPLGDDSEELKPEEAGGQEEPMPAEVPEWLEVMRPIELEQPTILPEDVSEASPENSGPLIGLRGVLPVEPVNIRPRRAAAYAIKLRVTDEQKQRVALLEQLLADEPKPKALPSAPLISPQHIFRIVIAVALLLPILWAIVRNENLTPLPEPTGSPGVAAMYNLVEALPVGAPILVAFDYEAGYAGEMDAAASAVIGHLMNRGTILALVSTSATGPALAERFINQLNQEPERLNNPFTNYVNLGYIPGGTIGLHGLTQDLHNTLPYDLNGVDVWVSTALRSVDDLAGFSMVLILTSDPETGRAWIEQAGPMLTQNSTVLAMITSAQAAPLVQPYFAGNPQLVDALIAGMTGGGTYENRLNTSGPARQAWDAYSLGLLAAVLIILLGTAIDMAYKAYQIGAKGK